MRHKRFECLEVKTGNKFEVSNLHWIARDIFSCSEGIFWVVKEADNFLFVKKLFEKTIRRVS